MIGILGLICKLEDALSSGARWSLALITRKRLWLTDCNVIYIVFIVICVQIERDDVFCMEGAVYEQGEHQIEEDASSTNVAHTQTCLTHADVWVDESTHDWSNNVHQLHQTHHLEDSLSEQMLTRNIVVFSS